jgi:hypothetical protein
MEEKIDWCQESFSCTDVEIEDDNDIVIEFVNKDNISFKLDKVCNSIIKTLNKVIEKENPTRGFLLNLYKPAQTKKSDEFGFGDSSNDGKEIINFKRPFQQTANIKPFVEFKKLEKKIDKKYKLQNALTTDKVNAVKAAGKAIDNLVEDINALIADDNSPDSLIESIVDQHKSLKEKIDKLINVKDLTNDEEANPTV